MPQEKIMYPQDGVFQVWHAHGDGGEHHRGPIIATCSTQLLAFETSKGQGWWGGPGGVTDGWAIKINGRVYALQGPNPVDLDGHECSRLAKVREEALKKLSKEELKVLGLEK